MAECTDLEEQQHGKLNYKVVTAKNYEEEYENITGMRLFEKNTKNNNNNTLDLNKIYL